MRYALALGMLLLPTILACDADAQIFRRLRGGGCGGGGGCGVQSQGCNISPIQAARANDLLQAPMAPQQPSATQPSNAPAEQSPIDVSESLDAIDSVAERLLPVSVESQSAIAFVTRKVQPIPSRPIELIATRVPSLDSGAPLLANR